jgi:RAP domain
LLNSAPLNQKLLSAAASRVCAHLAPRLWTPRYAPCSLLRCSLQVYCRSAPDLSGAAALTCLRVADLCRRAAAHVQAATPVGDGSRVVDFLLTWPGGKVAFEVDGPSHFLRNADGALTILNTRTRMRNHTLEQWGYTVVSMRLENWPYGTLESDEFKQSLAARLRAAGVPLPAPASDIA